MQTAILESTAGVYPRIKKAMEEIITPAHHFRIEEEVYCGVKKNRKSQDGT